MGVNGALRAVVTAPKKHIGYGEHEVVTLVGGIKSSPTTPRLLTQPQHTSQTLAYLFTWVGISRGFQTTATVSINSPMTQAKGQKK